MKELCKKINTNSDFYENAKMIKIDKQINGLGFFPVGSGLYNNSAVEDIPFNKRVMILGQDFGTEEYLKKIKNSENESSPTWKNLLSLLKDSDVPLENCFFTNAYMGVRKSEKMTGKCGGAQNQEFKNYCREFFKEQISFFKPKLIIALGKEVGYFLSHYIPDWKEPFTFKQIDEKNSAITFGISIEKIIVNFCLVTHPCYPVNLKYRNFKNKWGREAEIRLLKEAYNN